jgi:CPA2 family monovalent cation:H+ antiporter-2
MAVLLLVDVGLLVALLIVTALNLDALARFVRRALHQEPPLSRTLVVLAALALGLPFMVGAVRMARALGLALASEALPMGGAGGGLDLADAPRRALRVTLQIAILLVAGLPIVAAAQPFWPAVPWAALLAGGLLLLAVPFWRSASNLHGHARAGAQVILEALGAQGHGAALSASPAALAALLPDPELAPAPATATAPAPATVAVPGPALALDHLVPGLGAAAGLRLYSDHFGSGRTLRQANLRGRTGASVVALERQGARIFPTADEVLRPGDTLILIGSSEAVEAARLLLTAGP